MRRNWAWFIVSGLLVACGGDSFALDHGGDAGEGSTAPGGVAGSSQADSGCRAGAQRACSCSGNMMSTEYCLPDGSRYGGCTCDPLPTGGAGGSSVSVGTGGSGVPQGGSGGRFGLVGGAVGSTGSVGGAVGSTGSVGGAVGSTSSVGGAVGSTSSVGGAVGAMGGAVGAMGGAVGAMGGAVGATGGAPGTAGWGSEPPDSYISSYAVMVSGYVTSDEWQGYAWTATEEPPLGSLIQPSSFGSVSPGEALCVDGVVVADPEFGGLGLLGINMNQNSTGGAGSALTWLVTGDGLAYDVTNYGGSELRLMIRGAAGYPTEAWCALLPGPVGFVSWMTFNTRCWDGTGSDFDGSVPLQALAVQVPGVGYEDVPFDFCLNDIGVY